MKFFALFLLCGLSPLSALLPPLYQDIKEIQTILNSPIFSDFSGEEILSITHEENNYRIETSSHFISAEVKSLPSGIGPKKFEIVFQTPTKKTEEPL